MIKQNIIINKKYVNGRGSLRRNTLDALNTTDETSDNDNTQQQNENKHKTNNNPNSSLQQPAPPFLQTDINTLYSSQELASEITTDTTSLNATTEIYQLYQLVFKFLSRRYPK